LVGDVVVLDQGDNIPSDGLFIEGFNLQIDESNMTGESDTIKKNRQTDPFLSKLQNILIKPSKLILVVSGSTVSEGTGKMLSVQVGSHSEWGRTMEQLQQEPEQTPLQKKLKKMVFLIGWIGTYKSN
jgi:Ca2+-transporting ATPase